MQLGSPPGEKNYNYELTFGKRHLCLIKTKNKGVLDRVKVFLRYYDNKAIKQQ